MARQAAPISHSEEKFFKFDLERSSNLLQSAIEDALGVTLTPIARGMWTATIDLDWSAEIGIRVRALPVDGGTTVEVDIQYHSKPPAYLMLLGLIPAMILIVPFFIFIAYAQKEARKQEQQRTVMYHKVWTEIVAALGAAARGSYRGDPQVRVRQVEDPQVEDASLDAFFEPAVDEETA